MGILDSLFGVDIDLDGKVDATEDLLFMVMMDEEEKRQKKDSLDWIDDLDEVEDMEDDW